MACHGHGQQNLISELRDAQGRRQVEGTVLTFSTAVRAENNESTSRDCSSRAWSCAASTLDVVPAVSMLTGTNMQRTLGKTVIW